MDPAAAVECVPCRRPPLVEIDARARGAEGCAAELAAAPPSIFRLLQEQAVIVLRDLPEIHELAAALRRLAVSRGASADDVRELLRSGQVGSVETLAAVHDAFRQLRDSRFLSCLFSDVVGSFGLPTPILIDTGFCRMVVPELIGHAAARPELFAGDRFDSTGPGEAEGMLQGGFYGQPHRDLDARHYHFQLNIWFPLHDLERERSLLLFPEAYSRDVAQYGRLPGPERPDAWGFGPALQVPLRFGDALVFHSQHLHASPSPRGQNRFTVEIRVAAGCIDDNARIYRRLFWNLRNFQGRTDAPGAAADRAAELVAPARTASAVDARTAHALVHRLFRHTSAGLAAGYVRRAPEVFDDAADLDETAAQELLAAIEGFPCGEDLRLMAARLLWRKGCHNVALAALGGACERSASYFWMLETGRVAAEFGAYELAARAFDRAENLARTSPVALDRYTSSAAPPRIPGWVPQLLPLPAQRVARRLTRRARAHARRGDAGAAVFDHQQLARPLWKRALAPLLRSTVPHRGILPVIVRCLWRLRQARSRIARAMRSRLTP